MSLQCMFPFDTQPTFEFQVCTVASQSIYHLRIFHTLDSLLTAFHFTPFHTHFFRPFQLSFAAIALRGRHLAETAATTNTVPTQYPWPYPYLTHQPPPTTAPTFPIQPQLLPQLPHHHTIPFPYSLPPQEPPPSQSPTMIPPQPAPAAHTQPAPQQACQPAPTQWDYSQGVWQPFSVFPPVTQQGHAPPGQVQPGPIPSAPLTLHPLQPHRRLPLQPLLVSNHQPLQRLQHKQTALSQPPTKPLQLLYLYRTHLHLLLQQVQFNLIHASQIRHLLTHLPQHHNHLHHPTLPSPWPRPSPTPSPSPPASH